MRLRFPALLAGSRLLRDERGQAAVTLALAMLPVIAGIGAAIDYSRASSLKTRIQVATDATVLLAAKQKPRSPTQSLKDYEADLLAFAKKTFAAQIYDPNHPINAQFDSLTLNNTNTEVNGTLELTGAASAISPNYLMPVVGLASARVDAEARAVIDNTTYEIVLVLDNSGSMNGGAGGETKIQALRTAANKLVDAMLSSGSLSASRTRISIVPFSLAVQVGNQYQNAAWVDNNARDGRHSSIHWQHVDPSGSGNGANAAPRSRFDLYSWLKIGWGGCFETRPGTWATSDAAPNDRENDSYFVPMFAPDEPGDAGQTNTTITTSGSSNTAYYYNSYVDDNPDSCHGNERTGPGDYVQAQKKNCKYRDKPRSAVLNTTSGRGPNYMCNSGPVVRLTDNVGTLHTSIDAMVADGSTNLLEGFMWGWRTLSPNLPFGDGRAYNAPNNRKIIILMTDGMNSWSGIDASLARYNHNYSQYSPAGYYANGRLGRAPTNMDEARRQLDARTLEACTNFKALETARRASPDRDPNAVIYTVGFSTSGDVIDERGLALLRDCATPQNAQDRERNKRYAFVATSGTEIVEVFNEIARNMSPLRLVR